MPAWFIIFSIAHLAIIVVACSHLLLQDKSPTTQIAWVLAIILIPVFGVTTYLIIGTDRLRLGRERRRLAFIPLDQPEFAPAASLDPATFGTGCDPGTISWLTALRHINGCEATPGNQIQPMLTGSELYDHLEASILASKRRIWICFYVWRGDEVGQHFVQLLADAAARGVEVRVMVDELGSGFTPTETFDPLIEAGGRFSWAMTLYPRRNRWFISLRNHRKIAIFDHDCSYTGGMNIGEEYIKGYEGRVWNDLHLKVRGPALNQLAAIFAEDWHFATGERLTPPPQAAPIADGVPAQLIAGGPDHDPSRSEHSIAAVIGAAQHRLVLTTPYFVPDPVLMSALELAAVRGVHIRLLVSAETDMGPLLTISRSFFEQLLEWGIEICEYPEDIHHAKCVLVDDEWAMVGSINLDARSLQLNYEVGLFIRSRQLTADLEDYLERNLGNCPPLRAEDFRNRPLKVRLREGYMRLLAPML